MDFMNYVSGIMPALLEGLARTVQIFFYTLILSLPLGFVFAFGGISRYKIVRFAAKSYIWLFRGTPLILQLFFFYFFLPLYGIRLDRFPTAILTFVLNYAAYFAEIYRAGIQSIDKGQFEAAKSLGVSPLRTMMQIIIPQTIKRVLPPVSNETITLVKDTALVSVIAVPELLKTARDAVNRDVNVAAYVVAAGFYLLFTFLLTLLSQYMERKFSFGENQGKENE